MFKQRKPYHSPHTHHADFSETKQNNISMENIYFILISSSICSVLARIICVGWLRLFYPVNLWSCWSSGDKDTRRTESIELLPAFSEAWKYFPGLVHSERKYFFLQFEQISPG